MRILVGAKVDPTPPSTSLRHRGEWGDRRDHQTDVNLALFRTSERLPPSPQTFVEISAVLA
jgi:hypothetical protein